MPSSLPVLPKDPLDLSPAALGAPMGPNPTYSGSVAPGSGWDQREKLR